MRLIARAPIDASIAGRDYRPGDTLDVDGEVAAMLVEAQLAEPIEEPGSKKRRPAE